MRAPFLLIVGLSLAAASSLNAENAGDGSGLVGSSEKHAMMNERPMNERPAQHPAMNKEPPAPQPEQQEGGYGAEEEPETRQEEQGHYPYEPQEYPEAVMPEPICCVRLCPFEAPFFNVETCKCEHGLYRVPVAASAYEAEEHYKQQSYQSAYRKLNGDEFSPAIMGDDDENMEQPPYTIDTRVNRLYHSGHIVLWIGFAILLAASWCFLCRYLHFYYIADCCCDGPMDWRVGSQCGDSLYCFLASPSLLIGLVCFFSSLAYLAMATYHGSFIRCYDGREFFYARYVDWVITTPFLLYILAHFANADDCTWTFLFFSDILMIIAGLIGGVATSGSYKWIFFGFAVLLFIPILYFLCSLDRCECDCRIYDGYGNECENLCDGAVQPYVWFYRRYRKLMWLTIAAWLWYPIIWILGEGTGVITVNGECIAYTILDIISKVVFGLLIIRSKCNTCEDLKKCGYEIKGHPQLDHMLCERECKKTSKELCLLPSSIL